MSEVVNLRLARKRKARAAAELEAAQRRAQFGQTRARTSAEAERRASEARKLDGHLLPRPDEP
ncbi:MAG: DUF4169 family protein [Pseudomonadota bacterium]|nr:DUF4169 family protein [Pseudomonadota bacterium]